MFSSFSGDQIWFLVCFGAIIGTIVIIFVRNLIQKNKYRNQLSEYLHLLNKTYAQIEEIISENRYISTSEINQIKDKFANVIQKLNQKKTLLPNNDNTSCDKLRKLNNLEETFQAANRNFILKEKRDKAAFFAIFDDSQADAIITDEDQMLVLAGAGSGKTRTIEGKVTYLVDYRRIKPSEILLVSFTKATVGDLNSRDLRKVRAMTFHQIGIDILRKTMNTPPNVFDPDKKTKLIKDILRYQVTDSKQTQILTDYFLYELVPPPRDEIDDQYVLVEENINQNGFLAYRSLLNSNSLRGLTGQRFKSKEEARIANYFWLHGIRFEYESTYKYQIRDGQHTAYKPDFYLPDYDIYLEHFGITRDNRVPFTRGREDWQEQEKKYLEGIAWKRKTHRLNNTTLLETYSYDFTENTIYTKLETMLTNYGVLIREPDQEKLKELFKKIVEDQNTQLDSFSKLLVTFITQFKSTGKCNDPDGFKALYKINGSNPPYRRDRNLKFLSIAEKVYERYQTFLVENAEIDFEDMINNACDALQYDFNKNVLDEQYSSYKYIIIDEYQDISSKRMELIRLICGKSHAKLFCVGDDWQSIYRFSGADLSNILYFGENFPDYKQTELSYTYRYSQQLSKAASFFIQKNPLQKKKTVNSNKIYLKPINIVKTYGDQFPYLLDIFNEIFAADAMASIYVLSRYNSDINNLERFFKDRKYSLTVRTDYDDQYNLKSVQINQWQTLDIKFSTIHRSKGLEADYIILLNLSDDTHGFPSKIEDDPVISLVLPMKDQYPYEEERRLFYVALTRTKNKIYLLSNAGSESIFTAEIKDYPDVLLRTDIMERVPKPPTCPRCGRSLVTKYKKDGTTFFACPGYPECTYTLKF